VRFRIIVSNVSNLKGNLVVFTLDGLSGRGGERCKEKDKLRDMFMMTMFAWFGLREN